MIEVNIRTKAIRIAANDREHQRQIVMGCANDGFRAATDANPGLEYAAFNRRKYPLIGEGRARLASPRDWLALQERRKQIDLIIIQRFLVGQVVAE